MFSHLFARKRPTSTQVANKQPLLPTFHKIVVPAAATPFSHRAIRTACRIAAGQDDAEINLVYVMEVPRAFALTASLPGEEAISGRILDEGVRSVAEYGFNATTQVQRGRDVTETLLKYIVSQEVDLLVVGARPDNVRGVPIELARELYDRSPCPVVLDYIAGEVAVASIAGKAGETVSPVP